MSNATGSETIRNWPEQSREAASLVIEKYGEPQEVTETHLTWHHPGPWKRMVASKRFHEHNFPVPHSDSVESVLDYHVPTEKVGALAEFDGSVIVDRTAGEVSARCHDEEANLLALNLMHDIVSGTRDAAGARQYYAKEFADYRRKLPTPYMDGLRFRAGEGGTGDPDSRILSDKDLEQAAQEGERRKQA